MSKTYDKVEWQLIADVMRKMGFNDGWVELIMCCVTSISYSIVLNGKARGHILPTRSVRQGDPLSPFLFLFCMEGLSALLRLTLQDNSLNCVKASKTKLIISHLFFTDNNLIFEEASLIGALNIKRILKEFEVCFDRLINFK